MRISLLLVGLGALAAAAGKAQTMPDVGPTRIPFYTGNLSVDSFMHYWGTRKEPPTPQVTPESIAQLRRTSCFAACDYLSWPLVEPEPGHWDFSLFREHAEKLHAAGIGYNVFCWLHFPPKWFTADGAYVRYRCLEHDTPLNQMSLWAPATRRIYEEYYSQMARAMGDQIDFIRLAMPSEYGEIGFPVGMTAWLVPQAHVHGGFWCGDECARPSFRAWSLKRYRTLAALNGAWGTAFADAGAIDYPAVTAPASAERLAPEQVRARVRWLDFLDWYNQSWSNFLVWSSGVVKKTFPRISSIRAGGDRRENMGIIASLGYGSEVPSAGNDQSRHIAAMKRAGLAAQTPGDIGYFATRRVSSACAFYGVPYYTEPPGGVNRDREVQRIWMDASNGTQVFFDYPANMDGARDLLASYKDHLTGARSVTDVAVLLPTTTLFLHPEWGWPPYVSAFAEAYRERGDFEVVDERMATEGALRKLGTRVLVVADAQYVRPEALREIVTWVRAGGVLLSLQTDPVRTVDGSDGLWRTVAPSRFASAEGDFPYPDVSTIWRDGSRRVGKGAVVVLPGGPARIRDHVEAVARIQEDLAAYLPGARNGRRIDPSVDGILATLFRDRILYYNPGDAAVAKTVALRPANFGGAIGRPAGLDLRLELPPHSITSVPLR